MRVSPNVKKYVAADGTLHVWDASSGSFVSIGKEEKMEKLNKQSGYVSGSAKRRFGQLMAPKWMNGTFICPCDDKQVTRYLCHHLEMFYKNCDDVGQGMARLPHKEGAQWDLKIPAAGLKIPLTGGTQLKCNVEVLPHWSNEDHRKIFVVSIDNIDNEGIFLEPYDGLIKLINYARGIVRSFTEYEDALERLNERRCVPCLRQSHRGQENVALVRRIKDLADERLGWQVRDLAVKDWDLDVLAPILDEVALDEAFAMHVHGKCFACQSRVIDENNIPDDLIPVF